MVRERRRSHSTYHTCLLKTRVCHPFLSHSKWTWQILEIWVCAEMSRMETTVWAIASSFCTTFFYMLKFWLLRLWLMFLQWVFLHPLFFAPPVGCDVESSQRANHIWQKLCILLKRTPESHWFTPRQTVIFHSLPQCSLHWQNTSLMCSYEIKMLPQAINHSTLLPFISLHQITWLLAKWTASPPLREIYCIYFLWTEWDVFDLFLLTHCDFRHSIGFSSVQSCVPQV